MKFKEVPVENARNSAQKGANRIRIMQSEDFEPKKVQNPRFSFLAIREKVGGKKRKFEKSVNFNNEITTKFKNIFKRLISQ